MVSCVYTICKTPYYWELSWIKNKAVRKRESKQDVIQSLCSVFELSLFPVFLN